ncbi:hypothetical protein BH09GEM1_BH09GEM1_24310 [soil metagenome]
MSAMAWGIWHRPITTGLAGALVVVHVLCDTITGFKAFWYGGPDLGLALYRYEGLDFVLEATLMAVAWEMLRRTSEAPRWATHPLALAVLMLLQAGFDAIHHWSLLS